jgi:hypothetical protein
LTIKVVRRQSAKHQRWVGDLARNDTEATLWVLRNEPLLTPAEPEEAELVLAVTPPRIWVLPPVEAMANPLGPP